MLFRSFRESQAVVIIGFLVSVAVYVLLETGIFTLGEFELYYISAFALAELNLLALLSTTLRAGYHKETWRVLTPYLALTAAGCVGMLADLLIEALLNPALTTPLFVLVAIEFFFLTLTLGGDYLLVREYSKWRASQACAVAEARRV